MSFGGRVAPRKGAWIETFGSNVAVKVSAPSHPARVRGLKPSLVSGRTPRWAVAPRKGAWIET